MTVLRRCVVVFGLASCALAGCAQLVTFDVVVPSETPAGSRVFVTGPAFEPAPLEPVDGGHYQGTVSVFPGKLTFNFALEAPDAGELTPGFEPAPPHEAEISGTRSTVRYGISHWDLPADPAKPYVTFLVSAPAAFHGLTVNLSGSAAELGDWEMPGVAAGKRADGKFAARVALPSGSSGSLLISRGSWDTVERTAALARAPNHPYAVGSEPLEVPLSVEAWLDETRSTLTGNLEVIPAVASTHVASRDVIVYLPPGYGDAGNTARYPVLYMHDGNNLFDVSTSFVGEWNADEIAEQLISSGRIAPLIIVGVYNTGARISEYTPVPNAGYGGGDADAYGQFLVEELKPLIDARYRTLPDADHTGLAGSSLGGLVSTYFGLTHPDVFHRIAAVSPSVWWADRDLLHRVEALPAKLPFRIWIDIGTAEGSTASEEVANARAMHDAFAAHGWMSGEDLWFFVAEGAGHNEAAWSVRFGRILRTLYPPQ